MYYTKALVYKKFVSLILTQSLIYIRPVVFYLASYNKVSIILILILINKKIYVVVSHIAQICTYVLNI